MKRLITLGLLVLAAAVSPVMGQQEAPSGIKVTSILHGDGSRTDTQTDYDSLTAEAKTYNAAKKLIQRITYTTNEQGKPLEGIIYNGKDQIVGRVAYSYDEAKRTQEQLDYSASGVLQRRQVFRLGPDGRVSSVDTYDGKGNLINPTTGQTQKSRPRPPARR